MGAKGGLGCGASCSCSAVVGIPGEEGSSSWVGEVALAGSVILSDYRVEEDVDAATRLLLLEMGRKSARGCWAEQRNWRIMIPAVRFTFGKEAWVGI